MQNTKAVRLKNQNARFTNRKADSSGKKTTHMQEKMRELTEVNPEQRSAKTELSTERVKKHKQE